MPDMVQPHRANRVQDCAPLLEHTGAADRFGLFPGTWVSTRIIRSRLHPKYYCSTVRRCF